MIARLKDVGREQLVPGVHAVARGNALIAPSVTRRLIQHFVGRSSNPTLAVGWLAGFAGGEPAFEDADALRGPCTVAGHRSGP